MAITHRRGFVDGLVEAGQDVIEVIDGMFDRDTASAAARHLMDRPAPPDAIFVGNDHMAFAAMDTLRGMGLSIPGDVSIVGYDDVPRHGDLKPCKTAFIDAHTPDSDRKENFTIIGGGVS